MIRNLTSPGLPAMVVFVDQTECRWLRPLKRGFRHCFVALQHPSGWLVCDSLKSRMEILFLEVPRGLELAACYAAQGHHVLLGSTATRPPRPRLALGPLTCVSVAKRLLAIEADRVWTPWQLFGFLQHAGSDSWRLVPGHEPGRDAAAEPRLKLDSLPI